MHMFVVQAQRIACLARQSDLALVLQFQQTLLPRYIRQRSRLINKQTSLEFKPSVVFLIILFIYLIK